MYAYDKAFVLNGPRNLEPFEKKTLSFSITHISGQGEVMDTTVTPTDTLYCDSGRLWEIHGNAKRASDNKDIGHVMIFNYDMGRGSGRLTFMTPS